jgi:peptidoglycan/xylan/chitin deacetylase (PgdA/CDA1 family)
MRQNAQTPKYVIKRLLARLIHGAGVLRFARWWISRSGALVVLTFHRVLLDGEMSTTFSLPGMVVRQSTFESLLNYLSAHFEIVSLDDVTPSKPFDKNRLRFVITFDDGWSDNFKVAYPIARTYRAPITIFLCSAMMGSNSPFWPEKVAEILRKTDGLPELKAAVSRVAVELIPGFTKQIANGSGSYTETIIEGLKFLRTENRDQFIDRIGNIVAAVPVMVVKDPLNALMSWSEVAVLFRQGVTFGSHTRTHQILTTLESSEVTEEVMGSRRDIEHRLVKRCRAFAYPNGSYSLTVKRAVKEAGYDFAFTTEPGSWTENSDQHVLPRLNMWEGKLTDQNGDFSPLAFQCAVFGKLFLRKVTDHFRVRYFSIASSRARV